MPRAASLAAALEDRLGAEVRLAEGDKGVFDVVVDGELVFSRHVAGRFPEEREIIEKLKNSD